jgi:hypothetical protein
MIFVKQMVGMPRVWFLLCVYTVHSTRLGAALNNPHIKRKTHTDDQTTEEIIIGGVTGGPTPFAMHARQIRIVRMLSYLGEDNHSKHWLRATLEDLCGEVAKADFYRPML